MDCIPNFARTYSSMISSVNRWCQLADFRERGGLRFVRARWHMNLIRRRRRQLFIMMRSSHHFHTHFARTPLRFNHKQLMPTPLIVK